jgi:hypothetical protein
MDAREFLEKSCKTIGTSLLEMSAPGKRREVSRQRYLIAALSIERWEISARALSELLERRPESISRWASRGAELRQQSEEFFTEYEKLDRDLASS